MVKIHLLFSHVSDLFSCKSACCENAANMHIHAYKKNSSCLMDVGVGPWHISQRIPESLDPLDITNTTVLF